MTLQCRFQRDFKTTRMNAAGLRRHGDAIGDYEDACQYRSSQLRDKRMPVVISPAME